MGIYVASCLGSYIGLVALEFYWNVPDWQPRGDFISTTLILFVLGCLFAQLRQLLKTRLKAVRVVYGVIAAGQLLLGIYLLEPEPVKPGLLGRSESSPHVYRWGRAVLLATAGIGLGWQWLSAYRRPKAALSSSIDSHPGCCETAQMTANDLAPEPALRTSELGIEGMTCDHCVRRVERALNAAPGVANVNVDRVRGRAAVTFDPLRTDTHALCDVVLKSGYKPTELPPG
jgi:copper chaperone CopZ